VNLAGALSANAKVPNNPTTWRYTLPTLVFCDGSLICCLLSRASIPYSVYYYIRGGKLKYVISVIKLIRTEKQRVLKDFYMNIQQDFNLRSFVMQTT
jgi:hypothetical protein